MQGPHATIICRLLLLALLLLLPCCPSRPHLEARQQLATAPPPAYTLCHPARATVMPVWPSGPQSPRTADVRPATYLPGGRVDGVGSKGGWGQEGQRSAAQHSSGAGGRQAAGTWQARSRTVKPAKGGAGWGQARGGGRSTAAAEAPLPAHACCGPPQQWRWLAGWLHPADDTVRPTQAGIAYCAV